MMSIRTPGYMTDEDQISDLSWKIILLVEYVHLLKKN